MPFYHMQISAINISEVLPLKGGDELIDCRVVNHTRGFNFKENFIILK
jgi:hypothetical protein